MALVSRAMLGHTVLSCGAPGRVEPCQAAPCRAMLCQIMPWLQDQCPQPQLVPAAAQQRVTHSCHDAMGGFGAAATALGLELA